MEGRRIECEGRKDVKGCTPSFADPRSCPDARKMLGLVINYLSASISYTIDAATRLRRPDDRGDSSASAAVIYHCSCSILISSSSQHPAEMRVIATVAELTRNNSVFP